MMIVLQARTASTRLPGKVFQTMYGVSILERMCRIALSSRSATQVVLTTGSSEADDVLSKTVRNLGINVFRDDEDNVLKRFYACAKTSEDKYIMRITCDNYLVQPKLLDEMYKKCAEADVDYCFISPLSHFAGEIVRRDLIISEYRTNTSAMAREHVTYDIRNRNDTNILRLPKNFFGINHNKKITLDNLSDLLFMKQLEMNSAIYENIDCLEAVRELTNNQDFN